MKYFNVEKLHKVFEMYEKSNPKNFLRSCKLMKNESYMKLVVIDDKKQLCNFFLIYYNINKNLNVFKSHIVIDITVFLNFVKNFAT